MPVAQEQILSESIDLSDVVVDRENAIIRGVKLSGRKSRNTRAGKSIIYTDKAIQESVEMFDKCPVTVRGGHNRKDRDYNAQNGQLRNGRTEGLGTDKACSRFDWHLNPKDTLTEKILEDADSFPENCPLSQELLEWSEGRDDQGNILVEGITKDRMKVGVAVVYRGGINDSLFESIEEEDMEIKTAAELKARFPELVEELEEACCGAQTLTLDAEKDKVTKALADLETERAKTKELEAELKKYRDAEEKAARMESIRETAKEIINESFVVEDELMESLLGIYEGDRFKTVLTAIGKTYQPAEEQPEGGTGEGPKSKSGVSGAKSPVSRRKIGMHNR